MKKSLLFRLTLLYAVTSTLLAAAGFAVIYYRIHSATIENIDEEMVQKARMFSRLAAVDGFDAVRSKILEVLKAEEFDEEFYRLINTKAEVLLSSDMKAWGDVDRHRTAAMLTHSDGGHMAATITLPGGDSARVLSAVIGPSVILQMGESLEEADAYLDIFRNLFALLMLFLVLASTAIGWGLARRSLAGMAAVTVAAEDITRGDYSRRVDVMDQFNEVQRLGAAFNTMVDRIQRLLQSMEQINDNIAHDLRSPLARIRGIAEMVVVKNKGIEDFKEMAISTIEECDTLIELINTMLDITEIEAGLNRAKREQFDLSELVAQACDLFHPMAVLKKIQLQSQLPPSLTFTGDRKRMQRVVTNLLENAIKYTPVSGVVTVRAAVQKGGILLDVEDTGRGIARSDLPHIFKRFYRCDQSRSVSGTGLGLSLVKTYTESMKGSISVQSTPDHGSVFSLRFMYD